MPGKLVGQHLQHCGVTVRCEDVFHADASHLQSDGPSIQARAVTGHTNDLLGFPQGLLRGLRMEGVPYCAKDVGKLRGSLCVLAASFSLSNLGCTQIMAFVAVLDRSATQTGGVAAIPPDPRHRWSFPSHTWQR